jgi:hypothetical protein
MNGQDVMVSLGLVVTTVLLSKAGVDVSQWAVKQWRRRWRRRAVAKELIRMQREHERDLRIWVKGW